MPADRTRVLQQAQLFASRGQYEAAIAEWKKLAVDAPADGSIYNSIGDLQLKRNAQSDAASAFLQAASAFRAEGAILKAIAAFKKVLKCDPSRYEVYRHLGDLNAERGLISSAVQDYQTLGKYYLKEQRSKEALDIYKKIVSHDPSNLGAQQRVAELCIQENLQDEATKVYLQLGRERSAQGRYDEAKEAYLSVLRIDPKNSEAAQFVDSLQKNSTGAVRALKPNAASPTAKSLEPLDLLAEATRRIDEKQYAGAEAILNQMLTREPGNPQVCQLLARLHLQRGDVQVALGEYRFLAGAALRANELSLAESLIQEFLAIQPDSVPILELLGELHEEKGDVTAAALQYARAIELLLKHPEPGLESLHEELFEKVRALSADQALVDRLAARIKGTPVDVPSSPSVHDGIGKTVAEQTVGAAVPMISSEPASQDTEPIQQAQSAHEFSLSGAEPDVMDGFAAEPVSANTLGLIQDEYIERSTQGMQAQKEFSQLEAPDWVSEEPVTGSEETIPKVSTQGDSLSEVGAELVDHVGETSQVDAGGMHDQQAPAAFDQSVATPLVAESPFMSSDQATGQEDARPEISAEPVDYVTEHGQHAQITQEFSAMGAAPNGRDSGEAELLVQSVQNDSPEQNSVEQQPIQLATGPVDPGLILTEGEYSPQTGTEVGLSQSTGLVTDEYVSAPETSSTKQSSQEQALVSSVMTKVVAGPSADQPAAIPSSISAQMDSPLPDYEAYYTLGVAYKNMGLYEEAMASFQVSLKQDAFYLDSALMSSLCLKGQEQIVQAIRGLEAVLTDPRCQGAKAQAIWYELGLLYETEAEWEKAAQAFQAIPSFQDVPQRLAALKGKHGGGDSGFRYAA